MNEFEIVLEDLKFYAYHGVNPQESRVGNEFSVSLSVTNNVKEDFKYEDINSTISYVALYEIIKSKMEEPCKLLETVALKIQKEILNRWPMIKSGYISIKKISPPISSITGSAKVILKF